MKRFINTIILATLVISCSDALTLPPAASLFTESPEILEDKAIFRLATANMPDSSARVFPIVWGGDAEIGTDCAVSADAFVFGGESPVDSIVVTALRFGTGKTLSMTVELPDGTEGGKYLTASYTLPEPLAHIGLNSGYRFLTDSTEIGFILTDATGKAQALKHNDVEIALSVDKSKSTASEGVDFAFSDSATLIIRPGENKGSLKIKSLNPHPQAGKDKIVLNISYGDKFAGGEIQEMEISLLDTLWNRAEGKWAADTLLTDSLYMEKIWGETCTGYSLIPEPAEDDDIDFDLEGCLFKPSFSSSFSDYFKGNSTIRKGAGIDLEVSEGEKVSLQTFTLSNTNRYFSSQESSEDTESLIGMRILEGETSETDTLDLYIIDHTSRSFMPELEKEGRYAPEKPVAASPGMFLNLRFTKQ